MVKVALYDPENLKLIMEGEYTLKKSEHEEYISSTFPKIDLHPLSLLFLTVCFKPLTVFYI